MKNSLIRFQGQVVTVNVKGNVIEMITENDEKLVFEANKDNFSIDYNVGNLGSAVCFDENGKPYDSLIKCIPGLLACITITGCCVCLMEREWTFRNFLGGIRGILSIMVIELILSIPLYFLGKRYPWIKNNRKKVLIITCIILILVLLILAGAFGI